MSGDTITIKAKDFKASIKDKFYPPKEGPKPLISTDDALEDVGFITSMKEKVYNPFAFLHRKVNSKLESYKVLAAEIDAAHKFDAITQEQTIMDYCSRTKNLKFSDFKNLTEAESIDLIARDMERSKFSDLELFNFDIMTEVRKMKHFLFLTSTTGFPTEALKNAIH